MVDDKKKIKDLVLETLEEFAPKENESKIDGSTNPILDLGLDSHDGVDFACALSDRLGWDIPDDVNPFVNDDGKRARTVDEMVDLLVDLSDKIQEASHA